MTRSYEKPLANREKVPPEVKEQLRAAANYQCVLCSEPQTQWLKLEIHHLIPRSLGGSNDVDNLMPICPNCHSKIHSNNYVKTS
jgi:5-methylcytosine-specific restriction endonuclease McrA